MEKNYFTKNESVYFFVKIIYNMICKHFLILTILIRKARFY
ncbi:hypothetical protein J5TS2_00720 [Brevibacillus halotolerans]|nr:hypothetical protein J5TS2_00720 [Brevibacillus halotolerans]